MEFKVFGKTFSIKSEKDISTKSLSNFGNQYGLTYIGNTIGQCGEVNINANTPYLLHKTNTTIFRYFSEILKKVSADGFTFEFDGEEVDDPKLKEQITEFFATPTFDIFEQHFFTQAFCGGQVIAVVGEENALGEKKIKILDNRGIQIDTNGYGKPAKYRYYGKKGGSFETFSPDDVYDQLIFYDVDQPRKGVSLYNGVIMDALTDSEASKRQMYFFVNNARPDMIIMLDKDVMTDPEQMRIYKEQFAKEYQGSGKSHKTMQSTAIKDVKTLDVSNRDIELLGLRDFIDKKIAMMFGIDKRIIGFDKGSGGSRAELSIVGQFATEQIQNYAKMLDDFMTNCVKKFLIKDFKYRIRNLNSGYEGQIEREELNIKKVEIGIITRQEAREWEGLNNDGLPEQMNKFTISGNSRFIDEERQPRIDQIPQ